jgi:hypothetical protein
MIEVVFRKRSDKRNEVIVTCTADKTFVSYPASYTVQEIRNKLNWLIDKPNRCRQSCTVLQGRL